jgi:hypothetical protein
VVRCHDDFDADDVVVEVNFGGDMATEVVKQAAERVHQRGERESNMIRIREVSARSPPVELRCKRFQSGRSAMQLPILRAFCRSRSFPLRIDSQRSAGRRLHHPALQVESGQEMDNVKIGYTKSRRAPRTTAAGLQAARRVSQPVRSADVRKAV